jgi:hypothetical protein
MLLSLAKTPSRMKLLGFQDIPQNPLRMICWLAFLLSLVVAGLKIRRNLLLENLALRHQLIAPVEVTGKWSDFHTFELGVVHVGKGGDTPVRLQAAQLPQVAGAALPDVSWLSLKPTNAAATSNPVVQPGHGRD